MRPSLVIRADAGTRQGTGHLMRCLALAEQWQSAGGKVEFISACESKVLREKVLATLPRFTTLNRSHPSPTDWKTTSAILALHPKAWVLLDGYHFDPSYQSRIKESGHRLMVVDDIAHWDRYYADLIVNPNINGPKLKYRCEPSARMMLGLPYALLRSEFRRWRRRRRINRTVANRILITMGGSDPHNQSLRVLRSLPHLGIKNLEVTVVLGPGNPHKPSLQSFIARSRISVQLISNPSNMPELMAGADLGIGPGSSTALEFAFMGLPSVILVTAENQRDVAKRMDKAGLVINLGWHKMIRQSVLCEALGGLIGNPRARRSMSERGQRLVNGTGVRRIVSHMMQTTRKGRDALSVRPARTADARRLWQWANDPIVRVNSFNSKKIPWEEHRKWFRSKLGSPDSRFWILEHDQVPVAQVRYDRTNTRTAEIALSVAPQFQGLGIGTKALTLTIRTACKELRVQQIKAFVLSSNEASIRAFGKAGFEPAGETHIRRKRSTIFLWRCTQKSGGNRGSLH